MIVFLYAFISVFIVSLLSLLGALFLILKRKTFEALISYSLAVSSGILLGTAFFDLIPESFAEIGEKTYIYLIIGIISFFVIEKFINWHHCLEGRDCESKPAAYLSLIGDSIHNFLDGMIIAVSYLTNIPLGITTTLAVIAHEIPHELGDFTLLVHGGFSNSKAIRYNFLSALTAVLGTITVFIFSQSIVSISPYFVGFAAGNFLYIATSDLFPELHKKQSVKISFFQTICIISGVLLMWLFTQMIKG